MDKRYTVEKDMSSDGYFVKEAGVGVVAFCFEDTGDEAKKIVDLLNADHEKADKVEFPSRAQYQSLPKATYPEIDAYMARAREFLAISSRGHADVAALTATTLAEYMAFLDGKRVR